MFQTVLPKAVPQVIALCLFVCFSGYYIYLLNMRFQMNIDIFLHCWHARYYQFDKEVVRELLGKKLTGRLRKDLDDVSEKTNIPLKSCRRQVRC